MRAVLAPQALDRAGLDDKVVRTLGHLHTVLPVLGDVQLPDAPGAAGPELDGVDVLVSHSHLEPVDVDLSTAHPALVLERDVTRRQEVGVPRVGRFVAAAGGHGTAQEQRENEQKPQV